MNKNRPTPRHIQMKFHNTEEEKELLRTLRELKKKKIIQNRKDQHGIKFLNSNKKIK